MPPPKASVLAHPEFESSVNASKVYSPRMFLEASLLAEEERDGLGREADQGDEWRGRGRAWSRRKRWMIAE